MPYIGRAILSCFEFQEKGSLKLIDNDSDTLMPGCVFCDVSRARGFDVVWQDSSLVVFRDRHPAAKEHLLVTPVKHIRSVKTLRRQDVPLLKSMEEAAHRALDTLNITPDSRRLGFHIPPFNSVMHLHLHAQGLPYKSVYHRAKYPISEGNAAKTKGFSWFIEIGQAINILENGGKIGVLPC